MAMKWGAAGIVVLGVIIFSPKARQHLGRFLDELVKAKRQREQVEESQRRAAALSEILERFESSSSPTSPPVTTPVLTAPAEPQRGNRKS